MKNIDPAEFRDLGYLQEVNRRFLHPLGLALAMESDGETLWFAGIRDCRDDPVGVYFAETEGTPDFTDPEEARRRADYIGAEIAKRAAARTALFGNASWLQPVPGATPPEADPALAVLRAAREETP